MFIIYIYIIYIYYIYIYYIYIDLVNGFYKPSNFSLGEKPPKETDPWDPPGNLLRSENQSGVPRLCFSVSSNMAKKEHLHLNGGINGKKPYVLDPCGSWLMVMRRLTNIQECLDVERKWLIHRLKVSPPLLANKHPWKPTRTPKHLGMDFVYLLEVLHIFSDHIQRIPVVDCTSVQPVFAFKAHS